MGSNDAATTTPLACTPHDLSALVDAIVDGVVARLTGSAPPPPGTPAGTTPTTAPSGEWLTAAEAARYLGFKSLKAFYSAAERGQVPASRLGRRLRFHRVGLDRLLERRSARMAARVPSPGRES